MGAGGRITAKPVLERVPVTKPPFELGDLKKAIPPHCFKRSLPRSLAALFRDVVIIYAFYYLASNYIPVLPHPLAYVAWPVYWFFQGAILMGLWVMGHECGHHGFSEYQWLDDTIGFISHSVLLTPYFSFKYSHRTHHANTNSMDFDEVWIPKRKSDSLYSEILNNPMGATLKLAFKLILGFPLYFVFNLYGRKFEKELGYPSHFNPHGPIFNNSERAQIYLADAGVVGFTYLLYLYTKSVGIKWMFCIYGAPWIVMSAFFIILTYMHHTHPAIPHYDSSEWDWLRGALSTTDRDFGFLNFFFHDVTRTHAVHHLFPMIPHYHTFEARNAVMPILGKYYNYDDTPILKAIWRETTDCVYVEPDGGAEKTGIYWFRR